MLVRVGSALVTVLTLAAATAACTNEPDKGAPPAASSTSTAAPKPPTDRPTCQAALPPTWQQAIDGGKIDAGGTTMPLAVSGGGEIVAARDNGDTRDLLLIGADKSVSEIYAVPDPNRNGVGFAAIDDRWIVVGVDRAPRNANGVLPTLTRIDLIDRKGGPVRTVVQSNDEDFSTGGSTIDSVAFYGGKVYWITHEKYASSNGVTRSYDPETEKVVEVAAGAMSDLRAGAVGLTGVVDGTPGSAVWQRTELTMPAELPAPVADAA